MNRKVSYTYDDFKTNKPYEEMLLYLGKDNFVSVVQNMQARAEEVGFDMDEFDERYEACKERHENDEDDEMNVTAFTNQPLELLCGKYECFGNIIKLGKKIISYTPIMPVKVYKDIDNDGNTMYEVAFLVKGKWRTRVFPCRYLIDNRNVVKLADYDIDVSTGNARLLVEYLRIIIALNRDTFDRVKCVNHLGYADLGYVNGKRDHFSQFVPFSEDVVYSRVGTEGNYDIFKAIHECGNYETWLDEARRCRKHSIEARLCLSASFASVLLEPLLCQPFFVHLWSSTSGSGKSVALMLAISVWANPDLHGAFAQTADFTSAGGDRLMGFLKNLPVCIDETQLSKRGGESKLDIYSLTEGISKPKASRDNDHEIAKRLSWHNCFISTGETPLIQDNNIGAGAFNRLFEIKCPPNKSVIEDGISTADVLLNNYGFAGKRFLKLIQDEKIFAEDVREAYNLNRKDFERLGIASKNINIGAVLLVADTVASMYLFKDISSDGVSFLSPKDIVPFLHGKGEIELGKRAYEFFSDWIERNSAKFCDYDNDKEVETQEKYGEFKTVDNVRCACIISEVFREACFKNSYDPKAVLSSFKNDKLIFTNNTGFTKNVQVKKGSREKPRRVVLKLPDN